MNNQGKIAITLAKIILSFLLAGGFLFIFRRAIVTYGNGITGPLGGILAFIWVSSPIIAGLIAGLIADGSKSTAMLTGFFAVFLALYAEFLTAPREGTFLEAAPFFVVFSLVGALGGLVASKLRARVSHHKTALTK